MKRIKVVKFAIYLLVALEMGLEFFFLKKKVKKRGKRRGLPNSPLVGFASALSLYTMCENNCKRKRNREGKKNHLQTN